MAYSILKSKNKLNFPTFKHKMPFFPTLWITFLIYGVINLVKCSNNQAIRAWRQVNKKRAKR